LEGFSFLGAFLPLFQEGFRVIIIIKNGSLRRTRMPENEGRCVFCEIVAGRAEAHRIMEDDLSLCILDVNPFTRGHCLVIPKRHVPWWHELSERETASIFNLARVAANRMMKVFSPDFVLLYARGRRIPHTHLFLVPTSSGDVLDGFFNALERFQESPVSLARLRDREFLEEAAAVLRESD
jgi:histidine triad (HIT) family protein